MYTYIQILTYITYYIHIFIHTYMHTYIHSFMQAYIYSFIHTYIHNIHTFMLFNLEFAVECCLLYSLVFAAFALLFVVASILLILVACGLLATASVLLVLSLPPLLASYCRLHSPRCAAYARLYPLSLLPQLLLIKHLQVCIRSTNIYTTYTCIHTCNRIHTYAHV